MSPLELASQNEELARENEELRVRLEDAEQALEAIRGGLVESLIVDGPQGPRIFSLEGADHAYRVLVEAMNEGAATLSDDGTILYCNTRFAELLDCPLARAMGGSIKGYLTDHSRSEFDSLVNLARSGESRGELELLSLRGALVPIQLSLSVIDVHAGPRFCCVATDLRGQKRHQEIVRDERLARSVLEQAVEAVVVCDEAGRVIRASRGAAELAGRDPLGASFDDIFPLQFEEQQRPAGGSVEGGARRGEVLRSAPAWIDRGRGRRDDLVVSASPLAGDGGRIIGCVITMTDLSARRRAEQALRESEELYSKMFDRAPFAISLTKMPENRLTRVNDAFLQLFGFSRSEVLGKGSIDLGIADAESRAVLADELQKRGSVRSFECVRRTKSGERRVLLLNLDWVPVAGVRVLMTTIEDITARKQAEAEQKRLEAQLHFADRMSAVGTLVASVAHEINNPLTFILANLAEIIESLSAQAPAPEELLGLARETQEGAVRVREVVRNLRVLVRPEQDRTDRTDLRGVLRFAISLAQNEIRHRARLLLDLRETASVVASTHRLGQVFLNLLINAAQSIEDGHFADNQISVVSRRTEDGRALVEITDTGCGIPAEHLPHLFEPYFTTKPAGVGTGLGLSISREIVTSIGGEIQVASQPGKGTTFRVLLPTAPRSSPLTPPELQQLSAPVRGRVLVVDDEPAVARATSRILERTQDVVALHGGLEALGKLQEDPHFDVILCDLMMADLTGMDLHDRLAATAPELAERMIFMTGGAFTPRAQQFLAGLASRAQGQGRVRVIEKPCDPRQLQAVVEAAILHEP